MEAKCVLCQPAALPSPAPRGAWNLLKAAIHLIGLMSVIPENDIHIIIIIIIFIHIVQVHPPTPLQAATLIVV